MHIPMACVDERISALEYMRSWRAHCRSDMYQQACTSEQSSVCPSEDEEEAGFYVCEWFAIGVANLVDGIMKNGKGVVVG